MSTVLFESAHRLKLLTHCIDCGRLSPDSDDVCNHCGSDTLEQVSHVGEIYSYTIVRQGEGSFVLALVELSGGPMVTGRIIGVDRELRIGLPVELIPAAQPCSGKGSGGLSFRRLGAKAVA